MHGQKKLTRESRFRSLVLTVPVITSLKRTFGLIGFPLTHSFSRNYFNNKFLEAGLDKIYSYQNFELRSLSEFPEILTRDTLLCGLNVTIPYKEKIIPYLDKVDKVAAKIGAVNTIYVERNIEGKVVKTTGYNTDATGFDQSLRLMLQSYHEGALVLGTGGASKAVVYVLKKLKIPYITVSRDATRGSIDYPSLNRSHLADYPVIINTTPLGTFPDINSCPPIPYEYLNSHNLLFDLVYNPEETLFMKKGIAQGAMVSNGHRMLLYQAEESWKLWMKNAR